MLTAQQLWRSKQSITAETHLDLILSSVRFLPLAYWHPSFFFSGAPDQQLKSLTKDRFPAKFVPGKTHPVFVLKSLPGGCGARVCPCSTKKPFRAQRFRYICKNCRLEYGEPLTQKSYLLEAIQFNIPESVASALRFRGKVPRQCLQTEWK